MRARSIALALLPLLLGAASAARNATRKAAGCPGAPPCSGHGACVGEGRAKKCVCSEGFFGHDCTRKKRECARLRTCADCQDKANTRFCGWCADANYCVPKHVHRAMAKRGKPCSAWHEDTCPAVRAAAGHANHNSSTRPSWTMGDDTSVLMAESLVALFEGEPKGKPGRSGGMSVLSALLLIALICWAVRCVWHEQYAAQRRA